MGKKVRILVLSGHRHFSEVIKNLRKIDAKRIALDHVKRTYKLGPNSLCLHGQAYEYLVPPGIASEIKGVGNRTGWLGNPGFRLRDGTWVPRSKYLLRRYYP